MDVYICIQKLYDLYRAMNATPAQVITMIREPISMNSAEDRVFGYLIQLIGNMSPEHLHQFLRFVRGSSVRIATSINITFNTLDGAFRHR